MNGFIRLFLALLLWLGGGVLAGAQTALKCAVCQEVLTGRYHLLESPALPQKTPICERCLHLDTTCSLCGLPVKLNFQTLDDGRLLCEQDAKTALFSLPDAERIWEEARRDVAGIFSGFGTLPKNFTLVLVNRNELAKSYKDQFSWHDKSTTMGMTRTRLRSGTDPEHTIFLLNGLSPARLAAVCAHEYAHTWLNENLSPHRKLEGDSVEGFCELVAFKLMTLRNQPVETKMILSNAYTRGQINVLLEAEETYQFYRVLEWFKRGVDERIDKNGLARLLKLEDPPTPTPVWQFQTASSAPEVLVLKGISGTAQRRYALINNCTLQKNEEGKVRLGVTNVVVRCLEITQNSVVLQQRGSREKIQLSLRADEHQKR
jgi:hypothetical protein